MKVLLLGTAAGGALPQWNCGCPQCDAARAGDPAVPPRTQSSVAVSADGVRWVLLNASPDVRAQLSAHPALHPGTLRRSPIDAVLLSNADIDHALGLFVLREGGAPAIYSTRRVRRALVDGLRVVPVLSAYGAVSLHDVAPGEVIAVRDRAGHDTGLRARAFAVASKPPPYMLPLLTPDEAADLMAGDTVGWELLDADGATAVLYVPGVKVLDESLRARCAAARLVLLDGTCYTDDELVALGASQKTARAMGHAPLSGDGGLVEFLRGVDGPRKVLVHINNTNPILRADSPERAALAAEGITVGMDGMLLEA